jgi:DNA glycosylase AlkZ-like
LRMVGLTEGEVEGMIAAVDRVLAGRCMTRQELADAIGADMGEATRERLLSGWGGLLKPASYAGVLCSGPSRGQNVTFQRPVDWLGPFEEVESQEGLRRICRGYLHAYGPATHQEFGRWWGWASKTRQLFRDLGDELAEVDVEGRRAWALAADVEAMRATAPPRGSVRLLPGFDPYVLGSAPRTASVPEAFKGRVSRAAGWISPVVLVDGVAVGVWRASRSAGGTAIAVEPFDGLSATVRRRVERDARWLEPCLGAIGEVTFVDRMDGVEEVDGAEGVEGVEGGVAG